MRQVCFLLVAMLPHAMGGVAATAAEDSKRPNIVFILMDDLRWDDLQCMGNPIAKTPQIDRIAREGARFLNAFATTPLCSPSRGCFLTGLYAHTHGIVDNTDRAAASHKLATFPQLLQQAGYETGFVGKWHMGVDDSPRPGFDYWLSVKGQGAYLDPEVNENGRRIKLAGYVTDVFNHKAVEYVQRRRAKPFLLYLSHKAVHPNLTQNADGTISDPNATEFLPAERHQDLYAKSTVPRRPNCQDSLAGKPALQRPVEGLPPLSAATGTDDDTIRKRLRMLAAVDDGVGQLFTALQISGVLDNTLIVFTSDHGYFYGEHGLSVERRLAYEEAIRIPLLMRYPPLILAGREPVGMVLSLDLAPTLLEIGGGRSSRELHGRSLVPLFKNPSAKLRDSFLIEHSSDKVFRRMYGMGYQAIRTSRYKLIHYLEIPGADEFYDLELDPFELNNRIQSPDNRREIERLRIEMDRLTGLN